MLSYSKSAVLLAIAACAPMVCQAQDLVGSVAQAEKLNRAGQYAQAEKLCDAVIKKFDSKSKVTQQFEYVMPFYLWQKALAQTQQKKYDAAVATYDRLLEDQWKDKAMRERAMVAQRASLPNPKDAVGYDPLLTMAVFQKGYVRFKQATGEDGGKGDPSKFDEAIENLEAYLDLLESGKVSKAEKAKKLNGQVCFLLLQCYLLKDKPDFDKGKEYLQRSRKGSGRLPEDMVMRGLNTIIGVALKDDKSTDANVLELAHNALAAVPAMETSAAAVNTSRFIAYGSKAAGYVQKALKSGDLKSAEAATRIMNTLFGMVPSSAEVMNVLGMQGAWMGADEQVTNGMDRVTGKVYSVRQINSLASDYKKLLDANTDPEAYAIISAANVHLSMGSNRLGKAGYQVLLDRYPDLTVKDAKGKSAKVADKLKFQLAQLHYLTGNEEAGERLEAGLKGGSLGGDQEKSLAFNKMRRLLKGNKWQELIGAADEVLRLNKDDLNGAYAVTADFIKTSAYYKLDKFDSVLEAGTALLDSGRLKPGTGRQALKEKEVANMEMQLFYFVMDSYKRMGAVDPANYQKMLDLFAKYREKYPSNDLKENPLVDRATYLALECTLKQASTRDDKDTAKADMAKALTFCQAIADNWPDSVVYPNAQLMRGNIIITGEDEAAKPQGIAALQAAYEASLKQPKSDSSRALAANALFLLYSYAPEIPMEGETEEQRNARVAGYADTFWKEADGEGNVYALDMAGTQLRRAVKVKPDVEGAKAAVEAALKQARTVIAREATAAFKKGKTNAALEMAINSYVAAYEDAIKAGYVTIPSGGKDQYGLALTSEDAVIEHIKGFTGIDPADKFTNAIIRMACISERSKKLNAVEKNSEGVSPGSINDLRNGIAGEIRSMSVDFKPQDLTSYICLSVADSLVNFGARFVDSQVGKDQIGSAMTYYDAVISANSADSVKGKAGKARALKVLGRYDEAITLLKDVTKEGACPDATVLADAYFTLTECYSAKGDTRAAIDAGTTYLNMRSGNRRVDMNMLMAAAYAKSGDAESIKNALQTYNSLYTSNMGNVSVSAPACKAIMELLWARNTPSSGDRMSGNFQPSDRWVAWKTGEDYVRLLTNSGFREKMNSDERDLFNQVESLVNQYGRDAGVAREDREANEHKNRVKG